MKKTKTLCLAFCTLLATLFFCINVKADCKNTTIKTENYTDFDETEIYAAFGEIDKLEKYLDTNPAASYSELQESHAFLANQISTNAAIALQPDENLEPPIVGSFLWGCLFGPVGIILVAITTENNHDELHQAGCGCAVSYLIAPAITIGISLAFGTTVTISTW